MSYSSDLTKERILECASDEFLEKGFASANLRTIAQVANVTTGAIYRHFESKEGLFAALVKPALEAISSRKVPSLEESRAYPVAEMLSEEAIDASLESVMAFVQEMYARRSAFKLLLYRAEGSPYEHCLENVVDSYTDAYEAYVRHLTDEGLAAYRPGRMELHMIAEGFVGSICECIKHDIPPEDARGYLRSIVVFEHHGWYGLLGVGVPTRV